MDLNNLDKQFELIEEQISSGKITDFEQIHITPEIINASTIPEVNQLKHEIHKTQEEIRPIILDALPEECKLDSNVQNVVIENEDKMNKLIELLNEKFNLINKIL
jgi:hypothetical protein